MQVELENRASRLPRNVNLQHWRSTVSQSFVPGLPGAAARSEHASYSPPLSALISELRLLSSLSFLPYCVAQVRESTPIGRKCLLVPVICLCAISLSLKQVFDEGSLLFIFVTCDTELRCSRFTASSQGLEEKRSLSPLAIILSDLHGDL